MNTFRLDDDTGRPENVPDRSQMKAYITELDHLVKVHRLKQLHAGFCILLIIQGLRILMPAQLMAAEVMCLLFLKMAAIGQQYAA